MSEPEFRIENYIRPLDCRYAVVNSHGTIYSRHSLMIHAEHTRDALNAAHRAGKLEPKPEPVRYKRADGSEVEDERRENRRSKLRSEHSIIRDDRGRRGAGCGRRVYLKDRRKPVTEPTDERIGKKDRRIKRQGRREFDAWKVDQVHSRGRHGRRENFFDQDRRQHTGTRADRAKGGA